MKPSAKTLETITWVTGLFSVGATAIAPSPWLRGIFGALALAAGAMAGRQRSRERAEQGLRFPDVEPPEAELATPEEEEADILTSLAGGVAHEINNPLTYVVGNLEYVERKLEASDLPKSEVADLVAAVQDARQGAEKVVRIVSDLRTYARPDTRENGPTDLGKVLHAALQAVSNDIRVKAKLVTELDELPKVLGNETRLQRVFVNLLTNAAQAIPQGSPEKNWVALRSKRLSESEIAVEVHDSGRGIPDTLKDRIFEPFFSTKAAGAGSGLGLAICRRSVQSVGGRIELDSAPGRGTTFRVILREVRS
jgi:signal transduction histidine kinase